MAEKAETLKIQRFDGSNFSNWSFRVLRYLKQLGLKHCIEKEAEKEDFWNIPEGDAQAAAKRVLKERRMQEDNRCEGVLIDCIADTHLEYVKDKESPKAMWDVLCEVFDRKSTTNRFLLKKQLLTLKFDEKESLQDHFLKFDKLVRELKGAGAKMDEEDTICHLMLTMPDSYETVSTAMGVVSDKLTLDIVRRNYLDFEAKRKGKRSEQETEDAAFAGHSKPKLKCFSCGGVGHKKNQCPKRNDKKADQRKKPEQKANLGAKTVSFVADVKEVAAVSTRGDSRWYLDSGASEHMSNDREMFVSLQELKDPVAIQTAKAGINLLARHKGRVIVQATVDDEAIEVTMEDVLFIPELTLNLLSLRRLENSGKKVIFYEGKVFVEEAGDVVATGRQFGKLYAMDFRRCGSGGQAMVSGRVCRKLELWHHRFGHLGNENLQKLVRKQMVVGMEIADVENGVKKVICECCIAGKQTREPFRKPAEKRARRPLEVVHSDVCGPITPETWDGKSYFVSFIDDFTHLAVVYLLRTKNEVLEKFTEYEAMATAFFGERISRLRCDNGGEYTGHEMRRFCKSKGIQLETTVPYTPEQNGTSERFNRTVVEKVRAMLIASGLPKSLWGEAVYTATYVLNRSPSVAVEDDVTPYEAWQGKKPDVSNLRVFGSDCYVHVPKQRRKKLDSKTEKVKFVGYAPTGYRVWNGRKIFIARDVVFKEEELVFAKVEEKEHSASEEQVVLREVVVRSVEPVQLVDPVQPEDSDGDSEYNTGEESEEEVEGVPAPEPEEPNQQGGSEGRAKRPIVPPSWHADFDMTAFALCAEEYVDEIPSSVGELRKRQDWPMWEQAIQEELTSLAKNDTWRLVAPPNGARIIDNKWVFKVKKNGDGAVERYKARLVARGFTQREGFDFSETYSPVAKMATLRILLALANQEGWHLHQMDVKCAFLNGSLDEDIYMCQPPGFERGKNLVCKLNRSIYGLKQSSRNWNRRFHDYVTKLGFKRSQHDLCLYHWRAEEVVAYLLIYVDDILIAGSDLKAIRALKGKLSTEFEMKDMEEATMFLGLRIDRDRKAGSMTIDQKAYTLGVLKRFGMENCKSSPVPMQPRLKLERGDPKELTDKPYKELVGCLMYLTVTSRPDICPAVNYFASFQSSATEEHWVHLKRVLRYLQGTLDYKLVYKRADSAVGVEAFADADWGNDPNDRKSVSGFVLKLHGQTVNWSTRKQTSVALSSTEAELMSLCQASCEVMWVLNLLTSMEYEVPKPVTVYEDNQPCISVTADPRKLKRMKHIDVQYRFVKELIDNGKLRLEYLSTEEQVADLMTKGLAAPRFKKLREMLGIAN